MLQINEAAWEMEKVITWPFAMYGRHDVDLNNR